MFDKKEWVEKQWPSTIFRDPRVHKRALKVADAFLQFPDRSIPKRFPGWGDVKGCYRFLNRSDMDHSLLQTTHYENTLLEASRASEKVLFLQDTSQLQYREHERTSGLGATSDNYGQGIMFHSCLAVKNESGHRKVIGLACQKAWIRKETEKRSSEGDIWKEMIESIGRPPEGQTWITVGDRGSDIFTFIEGLRDLNWGCVIRTAQDRKIRVNGEIKKLKSHMRSLPIRGRMQHEVRARPGVAKHELELQVSWEEAEILPPSDTKGKTSIKGTYVRVWDSVDPRIEWILFTFTQIKTVADALEVARIYTERWVIEEYHKCLKTGCKIEEAQLTTGDGLLVLLGVLGVIATQLLQLRDISRSKPEALAEKHVEKIKINLVRKFYKLQTEITIKEFWRRVAMLGGFLGRKSDGDPGWQTLWYGWLRLLDMQRGAELVNENFS